ncbi:Hydrolase-4 domain-containing protein [Aphelenchoides fujianensis]|nr:Hydrolase-4 domain-containing protein [Aphelenchoides fujianensis]
MEGEPSIVQLASAQPAVPKPWKKSLRLNLGLFEQPPAHLLQFALLRGRRAASAPMDAPATPPAAAPSDPPLLPLDATQRSWAPADEPAAPPTTDVTQLTSARAPSSRLSTRRADGVGLQTTQTEEEISDTQSATGPARMRGFELRGPTALRANVDEDEEEEDVFREELKKRRRSKTTAPATSKYKFFPRLLLASANPPSERELSGTRPTKKRRHTVKCQRYNRFKAPPIDEPEEAPGKPSKSLRKDKRFLRKVDEYKVRKMVMECRCEERRCPWWDDCLWRLKKTVKFFFRLVFLVCCPPFPPSFFHKLAFWPPPREYFFFINEDATKQKAEAVRTAPIKVRRANKEAMESNNNTYRFGFEHDCFSDIPGAEGFIVRTKEESYLGCVFIRSPRKNPRYTIIFSHPNGSDISDHLSGIPSLLETARFLNCDLVAFDYSGYGISSGKHNERNLYADIEAVYEHVRAVRKVPEESIVLWGSSIGTAATVHLAVRQADVAGVMLFAPPASIVRALCWKRFCFCCRKRQPCQSPEWRCRMDKFCTIQKIGHVRAPVLIAHGKNDDLVPIEHGEALHAAARTAVPPLWIDGVGHNNIENSSLLWRGAPARPQDGHRARGRAAAQAKADRRQAEEAALEEAGRSPADGPFADHTADGEMPALKSSGKK